MIVSTYGMGNKAGARVLTRAGITFTSMTDGLEVNPKQLSRALNLLQAAAKADGGVEIEGSDNDDTSDSTTTEDLRTKIAEQDKVIAKLRRQLKDNDLEPVARRNVRTTATRDVDLQKAINKTASLVRQYASTHRMTLGDACRAVGAHSAVVKALKMSDADELPSAVAKAAGFLRDDPMALREDADGEIECSLMSAQDAAKIHEATQRRLGR